MKKRGIALALIAALLILGQAAPTLGAAPGPAQQGPTVVVIVLDGCPYDSIAQLPATAFLKRLQQCDDCGATTINTVFPSSTAAGHAAIFTGTYPEENGVTGKAYLRDDGSTSGFNSAALLERPTIFDAAHAAGYATAMISAKSGPRLTLSGSADDSIGPESYPQWVEDAIGNPPDDEEQYQDYAGWYVRLDSWITGATCAYLDTHDAPAVIGVNVGSIDKCGHRFGPAPAEETLHAIESLSEGIERIADTLERTRPGNWRLVITADHGMTRVDKGITIGDLVDAASETTGSEVTTTLDGGVVYIWSDQATCNLIADGLRGTPGVAEVIEASDELRRAELHTRHRRTPPLMAFAKEGYMFIESEMFMDYTLGSHGTCIDSDVQVPLIVCGPNLDVAGIDDAQSVTEIYDIVVKLLGIH